jgi:uncharacterized protein YndB with AHSA1/START domain
MPNIRHELTIGTPARNVYAAITSQQGLSSWWTPDVDTNGAPGSIAIFGFGGYIKQMRLVKLTPVKCVCWECVKGEDEWVGTSLSFELLAGDREALLRARSEAKDQLGQQVGDGEMTLLMFAQENWRAETPMFAECNYTWGRFLRSLKLYCETGRGWRWPNQHRTHS